MNKILILTTQINYGGAELLDVRLYHELRDLGFDVNLMSIYAKEYAFLGRDDSKNFPEVSYLGLRPGFSKASFVYYVIKLSLLMHTKGFKIIQTSLTPATFIASLARLFSGCKHIVGIHEVFSRQNNKSIYERFMPHLFSRKKTFFYSVSDYAKKAWVNFSKVSSHRVSVIYNDVEEEKLFYNDQIFYKELIDSYKINTNTKVIINVGRISADKNQLLLIDSLKNDLIESNIVLIFVGQIDDGQTSLKKPFSRRPALNVGNNKIEKTIEMRSKIEKLINKYNLKSHVHFLDYQKNVAEYIFSSDLLVHTTKREAFGIILVEAMVLGTPIISTNSEAIPEILKDTKYSLINSNDTEQLRKSILRHFELSSEKLNEIVNSGKNRAKKFTKKGRRASQIIQIIE